jgi:hypothetical protein
MRGLSLATRTLVILSAVAILMGASAVSAPQDPLVAQFRSDLHAAVLRSNLTDSQKHEMRGALEQLRTARTSHNRVAAWRAMRRFRAVLDSGAFSQSDREKIEADLNRIRAAHEK